MRTKLSLPIALMTLLSMFGCTNLDMSNLDKDVALNTSVALPVGNLTATMDDFVELADTSILVGDPNTNMIYIKLEEDASMDITVDNIKQSVSKVSNFTPASKPTFPQSLKDEINSNGFVIVPGNLSFTMIETVTQTIDFSNVSTGNNIVSRLDSATISASTIKFSEALTDLNLGSNPIDMEVRILDIPELSNFVIYETISGSGDKPSITIPSYKVRMTNNAYTLNLEFTYKFKSPNNLRITNASKITTTCVYTVNECTGLWGNFYSTTPLKKETKTTEIPFDFFNSSSKLLFANPTFKMHVKNPLGLPLDMKVLELASIDKNNNKRYANFNGSQTTTLSVSESPAEGAVSENTFTFDKDFGATNTLFEIFPKQLNLDYEVYTAANSALKEFIILPARMDMKVEAIFPFSFNPGTTLIVSDTIDADLSGILNSDKIPGEVNIERLSVTLNTTNGLPAAIKLDALFLDENKNQIYSNDQIDIPSAEVNNEGEATAASNKKIVLSFTGDQLNDILKTKSIKLSFSLETSSDTAKMTFKLTDNIKTHVSLFANGDISTSLDSIGSKTK